MTAPTNPVKRGGVMGGLLLAGALIGSAFFGGPAVVPAAAATHTAVQGETIVIPAGVSVTIVAEAPSPSPETSATASPSTSVAPPSATAALTPSPTPAATPTPAPTASPTAGPTASPSATPTPSAGAIDRAPTTDPAGFVRRLTENFDTPAALGSFLSTYPAWSAYPNSWTDTSKHGKYSGGAATSVAGGILDVLIRTDSAGVHRVENLSPKLSTGSANQLYGRYEIRMRADSMRGYKAAYLLWPQSEAWPRDGEIDFPEGDFDSRISAFNHRQGASSGSDQDAFGTSTTFGPWHTFTVEWTPTRLEFYVDHVSIGRATSRIPNTPMRWQLQNETSLSGITPAAATTGHVQVQYVAVWAYQP